MSAKRKAIDLVAIRAGLQRLPLALWHEPGQLVDPTQVLVVGQHRTALDPDRALVVGNRGMGKSFWAHALVNTISRETVAKTFRELGAIDAIIGFNARARSSRPTEGEIAPSPDEVVAALDLTPNAEAVWRCVMVRAALWSGVSQPAGYPQGLFSKEVEWVATHREQVGDLLTIFDDKQAITKRKLVLVFDALDRLGDDWEQRRNLQRALMKLAMEARSFRALRLKLFLRSDQYADARVFEFPDASKIKNERAELHWIPAQLYELLFWHLSAVESSRAAINALRLHLAPRGATAADLEGQVAMVKAIAGEFMGSDARKGRVYTWLPRHLSDAREESSPRTFLTAWREAAMREPAPAALAIDHLGLQQGVVKASEARVSELQEDYWWITSALSPLHGVSVPVSRREVVKRWVKSGTVDQILRNSEKTPPVMLETASKQGASKEEALLRDLEAIGVIEVRPNGSINVPDIYRLRAGIKRKGGVPTPRYG